MGVLEKISEALHNNEEKTVELSQKIFKLISEWETFEKDLNLSSKCLKECFNEMESKEMHLGSVQESVAESLKELNAFRESVERKREEVERKEEELESKWKDLSLARKGFAETVKLREEKLNDQEKVVERLRDEVEFEQKRIGDVEEKLIEIRLKEKNLNRIQSWIHHETHALELKDQELAEKMEEIKVKEHNLQSMKKELEDREMWLESLNKELVIKECKLDNVKKELRVKENNLDYVKKELRENENNLQSVKKELRENENILEPLKKALAVKESRLDGVMKEVRVKESKLEIMKKELREKENNLEYMNKELAVKEIRLDSMQKEVTVKESKLEFLKKELGEKENSVESVNKELAVRENRLEGVRKVLRVKESNLDYLEKELRENEKKMDYAKKELREKETNLDSLKKELTYKENMLDSMMKELQLKGSNLNIVMKELKEKEKNLDFVKKELREEEINVDTVKKELYVKENMLDNMKKELGLKENNLDIVMKELKEKEKNLDFVKKELGKKENALESVKKESKAEADNLIALRKQLESKEFFLSSMKKELEHKEKFHDVMKKKLELHEENLKSFNERLNLRERELDSIQEAYKQRFEELNSKEKKLDSLEEFTKKNYEDFQSEKKIFLVEQGLFEQRMKEVILREERVKDRLEELESREKHFEDRCKKLGEKEKQLNAFPNAHIKSEPAEEVALDRVNTIVGNSTVTSFVVIMDGKSLQIFLNEHEKELDLMSDKVFEALQMSPDPAQLVLDAMEGFYPPHLRKGETEFEGSVARRSCILLLEQLIRVSPEIRDFVRGVARNIARDWRVKMKVTKGNQHEILGFLYLLAAYNLVSSFKVDDLMILLEIVAKHDKFAELCGSLGMKQNLPGFVQNLLTQQQHLEAIRYAYAFELVDQFPPTTILKNYMEYVERNYVNVCEKETCSFEEKIEAIEQRVASIRAVIRCILNYKLQSKYPIEHLEECIEVLTRQKEDQAALCVIYEAKTLEQASVNQLGSTNPSSSTGTKALNSASFSARTPSCTLGHSNSMAIILMNMRGEDLQNFLNKHLKEHKLLRSEVFSALLMSLDSGMLVLEALVGFYPPEYQKEEIEFNRNIIRQSCILLLEQFMKLSPGIKPEAKLEASKLAFAWKAKMMGEMENHLAILGFLLLVGSYRLASAFDKDELKSLYHKVSLHLNTSEICHALGISNNTSKESKRHKAQGCTDESICNNMDMKCEGHDVICNCASSLHRTSDPALLVLDAFRSCHPTKLGRCENFSSVMRSFSDLLDQLREVSPEIKPHVKAGALAFAVDWYSTLTGSQLNTSEFLAFVQLLAIYKIIDSFHSDALFGLLEKVQPTERVVTLFKILGLTDKIRCFVQYLINKKQWMVAFTCVYEFDLVNLVSPVMLLRDYVRHSEEIAKQILHAGNGSHRAQMKAISYEINALRNAVRHIVDRGLQSEYSPSQLQEQIVKLQCHMSNSSQSSSNRNFIAKFRQFKRNKGTCRSAPIAQVRKELTKNRSATADFIHRARGKQNFKRHRHLSMRR